MAQNLSRVMRLARRNWNRVRWLAVNSRLPRSRDGRLMLHVGCGNVDSPGYINIDARPMKHVHFIVHDIGEICFVPPGSIDLIYMSHVMEHVSHLRVSSVLRECRKVLKPGGVLRLGVPDFDLLCSLYEHTGKDMKSILGQLMGGQDYAQNFHFSAFNAKFLAELLTAAGFVNPTHWDPARVDNHDFEDWTSRQLVVEGKLFPISLNMQATRPT